MHLAYFEVVSKPPFRLKDQGAVKSSITEIHSAPQWLIALYAAYKLNCPQAAKALLDHRANN
jgi:hypothetical protein